MATVMTRPSHLRQLQHLEAAANLSDRSASAWLAPEQHGSNFEAEVREAFSYEEAMNVIQREFDIVR